ncbi:MAG: ferritin family protein [Bacteroidales bacterium]|nr:ferritin family protein [Bacteroidales bacterium]MCF8458402.1 ferritin family protein [Bacteroidales bacterium]
MKEFESIDDILDFAIQAEQNAVDFYTDLAKTLTTEDMKATFQEFAKEEISHKARLIKIKEEGLYDIQEVKVTDLKIADYVVSVKPSSDMTYQDALILAMKREKAAFRLYTNLAAKAPNDKLKRLFESLALEESKHKLRFEIEYDEYILREN